MTSLEKLNQGRDLQAIICGTRSLLEIATDMALVHRDKTNESGWRIRWWGESAKLKAAKAMIEYFNHRVHKPIPDEYRPLVDFVKDEESGIEHLKSALWPDPKRPGKGLHPERWTGSKALLIDIQKADDVCRSLIRKHLEEGLKEFYETEYRRLNWNTHGSGLTGIRNVSPQGINSLCALGFDWCARLALICTDIVIAELNATEVSERINELNQETASLSQELGI